MGETNDGTGMGSASSDQPEVGQRHVRVACLDFRRYDCLLQGSSALEDPLLEIEDENVFDVCSRELLELEVRRVAIQIVCPVFF